MLPFVMSWNLRHGDDRVREKQQKLLNALWGESTVSGVLRKRGVDEEKAELGEVLDAIIRELGQPRSLTEVGISRDQLDGLASNCLKDPWSKTNPIPLTEKIQILEILEMAMGDR